VFCEKSPQVTENKGREVEKEQQEKQRARKLLVTQELGDFKK
jgi:hypothetical protein